MRALPTLCLALLLSAPLAEAQPARTHVHRLTSAPLAIALPTAFETDGEIRVASETSVQVFTRLGAEGGPSPNTYVIVETHRGFSWLKRLLFRHGVGIQRQTPSIALDRVDVASLPLSESLAAAASSAFVGTHASDGASVGLVVRGCEGAVCYSVSAQGPNRPGISSGRAYAGLLAGLALTD